eukprot:1155816-Rhodomonas_salina.2
MHCGGAAFSTFPPRDVQGVAVPIAGEGGGVREDALCLAGVRIVKQWGGSAAWSGDESAAEVAGAEGGGKLVY